MNLAALVGGAAVEVGEVNSLPVNYGMSCGVCRVAWGDGGAMACDGLHVAWEFPATLTLTNRTENTNTCTSFEI